jgi:GTP-binding protein
VKRTESNVAELLSLGFKNPILLSAEHSLNLYELTSEIAKHIPKLQPKEKAEQEKNVKIAIIGRPNAGKSTLLNAIVDEERVIVSKIPGTTRDSIKTEFKYNEYTFELIDTPGIRKKAKIYDKLEKLSVLSSINSIKETNIVIIVSDITSPLDVQDLKIAAMAIKEGKAVIFAFNKFDLSENKEELKKELSENLKHAISEIKDIPHLFISAEKKEGIPKLFHKIINTYKKWNFKTSTAKINNLISALVKKNPPPMSRLKRKINIKYATQKSSRPPHFLIFTSTPKELPESYKKYLINGIIKEYDLGGIPIRITLKSSKNPYKSK